jgi:hypothetical protein
MRTHRLSVIVLAAALALPSFASGQAVRGRVVDALTRAPVANALIELRDLQGKSVMTALTSPAGAFLLAAPAAGRYGITVKAIGYKPRAPGALIVQGNDLALGDLLLIKVELRLPDLVAIGHAKSCGRKRILADDLFGRLLNNARNALDVMSATIQSHQFTFTAMTVTSEGAYGRVRYDSVRQVLPRWPLESVDPDLLRVQGFGQVAGPASALLTELDGPDATVLFADWFLDSHCFALQQVKAGADTLRIQFTPAAKSRLIDVSGELDLDAHTFALLRMAFRAENLPHYIDKHAAGGEIDFAALPGGLWMPRTWTIWAPSQGSVDCLWEVVGLTEKRGMLLNLETPGPAGRRALYTSVAAQLLPRQTRFDHKSC